MHKIFNEFQAQKYIKNYGMSIVGVRPANVTGPDKVRGSTDHVQIMVDAARGKPVHLPQKGLMRTLIHVEDIAEVFARVLLAEAPRHHLYNSGGIPVSLGELADIVRGFLPDAQITFAQEGGREDSGNYLVDWSRLAKEFGIEYPGLHTRVLEVINDVRRQEGLPLVGRARDDRQPLQAVNGRRDHALQPDLGGLSSRPDLAAAGPVRVGGAPRAEGPDALRRRRVRTGEALDRQQRRRLRPGGGVGASGTPYVPGKQLRVDKMAETGLYEDGKKGIRRPGDPHLRVKDMDRDGVDAEVIYGILAAAPR